MNQDVRIEPQSLDPSRFSSRDFVDMLDVGAFADMRVELIQGRLEKLSPAQTRHSRMNATLASQLEKAYAAHETDLCIDLAVEIDEGTIRGIDIAIALGRFTDGVPPASDVFLAVEISVTTLSRGLGSKVSDYARAGIPHYWVVDDEACIVHVMAEPSVAGYAARLVVRFGEPLAVPGTTETIIL